MKNSLKILIILFILTLLGGGGWWCFSKRTEKPPPLPAFSQPLSTMSLQLTSPAFSHNQLIPARYTCDGADVNPSLKINGVSANAKSLVLIMDDPDAPSGVWDHWLVYNINPQTVLIEGNSIPAGSIQVVNSFGRPSYGGPCPPSGVHHYYFKLYALAAKLEAGISSKKELEEAIKNYLLAQTEMIGLYQRSQ